MIIGISGKIGSGKDTFADLLIKHAPTLVRKSFAYKLKKIGSFLTGTKEELWFTQEGKNIYLDDWGMTIGEFQQKLGTDAARNGLHEETWAIALFADYDGKENWVIPDVRFPNEAHRVTEKGGKLIRLNGDPGRIRANSKRDLFHPSETSLDNYKHFDNIYDNQSTLQDLDNFAENIVRKYGL